MLRAEGSRVTLEKLGDWLNKLGYIEEPRVLHLRGARVPDTHPHAIEIQALLRPEGAIKAHAVFDVEGVPTVIFVGNDETPLSAADLDAIRKKVWNQNLVSVVIQLEKTIARAFPARKLQGSEVELSLDEAQPDGPFSALDVTSANLLRRQPDWFDIEERVDRKLLANLSFTISKLSDSGFLGNLESSTSRRHAELLMGQVLFISYLEHRDIVGITYRDRRSVERLHDLVANGNRRGIRKLIDRLCQDFNGDFLGDDSHDPWSLLNQRGYTLINQFLSRTDMETGQQDFWNYDFSYIPVELLSGLYEFFLTPYERTQTSAYYTPRHLAILAVDQALSVSTDPLSETIFDGACGSGVLLTTAFRRLIALSELSNRRQLSFKERIALLIKHIFGADINLMACRVTAFSLYLSLLEGLDPADILEAQEREKVRLPRLDGINLRHGESADFFTPDHGFRGRRFNLIISNPPWKEPAADSETSADNWSKSANVPFVRRQIAGAYAMRALDFLSENGRLCIILPTSQFLASTSTRFVSSFLQKVRPIRLINFGDFENLLFPTAKTSCLVFLGSIRNNATRNGILFDETFDYCVPKANMGLAYGLLTTQSADRHTLQTLSVSQDPQMLITLMWGDTSDLALWTRLATFGTFDSFRAGPKATRRWVFRKGVHLLDRRRRGVSSRRLRDEPFVHTKMLNVSSPILHSSLLTKWPKDQQTVASIDDNLLRIFDGPRVLFPDGFSRQDLSVRAVYFDTSATFTHSIGVIAGTRGDASLLQFVAVYLRSSLAQYFLMMRGWKMLCQRNGVHLADIKSFPFFDPANAPDSTAARRALERTAKRVSKIAQLDDLDQIRNSYAENRNAFDKDVFDFFSLSEKERELVLETVSILMPSIRPRQFSNLDTPAQKTAQPTDFDIYGSALANALTEWRQRTGGNGRFHVEVMTGDIDRPGSIGTVRIEYTSGDIAPGTAVTRINDQVVRATLSELRSKGLMNLPSGDVFQLIPDIHIWTNGVLYLTRLLARRNWTIRQALRDAEHIVRTVQERKQFTSRSEVA